MDSFRYAILSLLYKRVETLKFFDQQLPQIHSACFHLNGLFNIQQMSDTTDFFILTVLNEENTPPFHSRVKYEHVFKFYLQF